MPTTTEVNAAIAEFILDTQTADEKINGAAGTVTDRHGKVTDNLQKILEGVPNANADKLAAETAATKAETAQGAAETAQAGAEAAQADAQVSAKTLPTWTLLKALSGTSGGEGATVLDDDTSSHLDLTATGYDGESVPNAGIYSWSVIWNGWSRIGDTGITKKLNKSRVSDTQQYGEATPAAGDLDGYTQVFFPSGPCDGKRQVLNIVGSYTDVRTANVYRAMLDLDTLDYNLTELIGSYTTSAGTAVETAASEISAQPIILQDGEILAIGNVKIRLTSYDFTGAPFYQTGEADPGGPATGTAQPYDYLRLEIGYTTETFVPEPSVLRATKASADKSSIEVAALLDGITVPLEWGAPAPGAGSGKTQTQTYVYGPFDDGFIVESVVAYGSSSPGEVALYAASVVGDQVTVDTATRQVIDTVAGVATTYSLEKPLVIPAGGYIANRPKDNLETASAGGTPYRRTSDGDTATTAALTNSGSSSEHQIRFIGESIVPVKKKGTRREITVANGKAFPISSDSIAAGFHSLPGKAWVSILGDLTDWRIVNGSQPGRDVLGMADDLRNGELFWVAGVYLDEMVASNILIMSGANDAHMVTQKVEYFQKNFERAGLAARAAGMEPIFASQASATDEYRAAIQAAAKALGCRYFDTGDIRRRMGGIPDWENQLGHTTIRSSALYHQPFADLLEGMGRPVQGIKAFRPHPSFTITDDLDLLYADNYERAERWKALNCFHRSMPVAVHEYYDAIDEGPDLETGYVDNPDEMEIWRQGSDLSFEDYALIEAILPGGEYDLDEVRMTLDIPSGAEIYLRDWDYDEGLIGKPSEKTVTAAYLAVWDHPVGRWVQLPDILDGVEYTLSKVKGYVEGRKLTILVKLAGAFSMAAPKFAVRGNLMDHVPTPVKEVPRLAAPQLLSAPTFDASLTGWTQAGTPSSYAPIDQATCLWGPDNIGVPVSLVAEITSMNTLEQSVVIAPDLVDRKFVLEIYHRYNPKAYVDPTGRGWDSARYVDRTISTFPADAPMNYDTFDMRRLVVEWAAGSSIPARGGSVNRWASATMWHPARIERLVPAGETGDFTFRLSCQAGTIEIAMCTLHQCL